MGLDDVFRMWDRYLDSINEKDIQKELRRVANGARRDGFCGFVITKTTRTAKPETLKVRHVTTEPCGCAKCDTHAVEDFIDGLKEE